MNRSLPSKLVLFSYDRDGARFKAEFVKADAIVEYKYLTQDEYDGLEGHVNFVEVKESAPNAIPYSAQDLWDAWETLMIEPDTNFETMLCNVIEEK